MAIPPSRPQKSGRTHPDYPLPPHERRDNRNPSYFQQDPTMHHPLSGIRPSSILHELHEAVASGWVSHTPGTGIFAGLDLYDYTQQCTAARAWNRATTAARGLVLHTQEDRFVTLAFPKFFNLGEGQRTELPNLPFEAFEKMDGSLGIGFFWQGQWHVITRGNFNSDQARWATTKLREKDLRTLHPGTTYLFEIIYPENQIVVGYDFADLVLLAGYHADGTELSHGDLHQVSQSLPCPLAPRHDGHSIDDLVEICLRMGPEQEGFVVRYQNGLRIKLKGRRYCELHRAIAFIRPTQIWEFMVEDRNLDEFRQNIPDEFLGDFDCIRSLLESKRNAAMETLLRLAAEARDLTNKDLGQHIAEWETRHPEASFLFNHRTGRFLKEYMKPGSHVRRQFHRLFRPAANQLEGYHPSKNILRISDANGG